MLSVVDQMMTAVAAQYQQVDEEYRDIRRVMVIEFGDAEESRGSGREMAPQRDVAMRRLQDHGVRMTELVTMAHHLDGQWDALLAVRAVLVAE